MNNPSDTLLEVFAAVLRKLELPELETLQKRFTELREGDQELAMIER